ncbi:MAG: acyl carrier protein [Terriglobales bacterium]
MVDLESRLINCFATVFPELDRREIPAVSAASIANWDSLAGITLISVIEEEFSLSISPDDVPDLISFELILDYLRKSSPEGAP